MTFSARRVLLGCSLTAAMGLTALGASPAMASTCDSAGQGTYSSSVCGSDSSFAGVAFSGKVGTYSASSRADETSSTITWGDGSSAQTVDLSTTGTNRTINGAHTYAAVGTYTVSIKRCAASGSHSSDCATGTAKITITVPSSYTLTLDSYQSDAKAEAWQLPATATKSSEQRTTAYCDAFGTGAVPTSDVCGESVTSPYALVNHTTHSLVVSGTVSTWEWKSTMCGTPVKLSDGFQTGIDAQFMFASPYGQRWCKPSKPLPIRGSSFEVSLDNGATWQQPVANGVGTTPAANHTYTFSVTGTGARPRFRFRDQWPQDNHGTFTIKVI